MRKLLIPVAGLLVAFISTTVMAADVESGLQVGDSAGAFNVKDITGPRKGKSLCYR